MATSIEPLRILSFQVTFSNCRFIQQLKQNVRACHVTVQNHETRPKLAYISSLKLPNEKLAARLINRLFSDKLSSATVLQPLAATHSYSVLPQRAIYTTSVWLHGHSAADCERKCWNCGRETDALKELFFCECGVVQSPASDVTYFTLFNMDENFDIDLKSLGEMYKHLQKHLHPDKYSQKTEMEQRLAEQQSALLNKAYFTLLKPLSRALYILNLHGLAIDEDSRDMSGEFLMEVLELNERIGEGSTEDIKEIEKEINSKIDSCVALLGEAFSQKNYAKARDIAIRMKYYVNVESKVKTFYRDRM